MTEAMVKEVFDDLKQRYESKCAVTFSQPTWHDGWGQVQITNTEKAKERGEATSCANQIIAELKTRSIQEDAIQVKDEGGLTGVTLRIKVGNW